MFVVPMGDVKGIVRSLGLGTSGSHVEAKAYEFYRLSTAKLGSAALGSLEIARAAVCVDLACTLLDKRAGDPLLFVLRSGVTKSAYQKVRLLLQRALGVSQNVSPRELCIQFGCSGLEPMVRAILRLYKERFIAQLQEKDRAHVGFSRPVFLAAAFVLVAKKNRIRVARPKILTSLGISSEELNGVCQSMIQLLSDYLGTEDDDARMAKTKRKRNQFEEITNTMNDVREITNSREDSPEYSDCRGGMESRDVIDLSPDRKRTLSDSDPDNKVEQVCSGDDSDVFASKYDSSKSNRKQAARERKPRRISDRELRQATLEFAAQENVK